jgi:hypothetical protein
MANLVIDIGIRKLRGIVSLIPRLDHCFRVIRYRQIEAIHAFSKQDEMRDLSLD